MSNHRPLTPGEARRLANYVALPSPRKPRQSAGRPRVCGWCRFWADSRCEAFDELRQRWDKCEVWVRR